MDSTSIIRETGFVPLLSLGNAELAIEAMRACYRGGVRAFEYTNRQPNSFEVFNELKREAERLPGFTLGIGTILDKASAEKYIKAGAHFIIAPILDAETASICNEYKKPWIPGCATLTEIVTAKRLGAEVIKIFPGSVLGPGFVKSIMPVVPDLHLMITGGVEPTEKSIVEWFTAGATCVGLGSQLFTKEIVEKPDWITLEQKARFVLNTISTFRAGQATYIPL